MDDFQPQLRRHWAQHVAVFSGDVLIIACVPTALFTLLAIALPPAWDIFAVVLIALSIAAIWIVARRFPTPGRTARRLDQYWQTRDLLWSAFEAKSSAYATIVRERAAELLRERRWSWSVGSDLSPRLRIMFGCGSGVILAVALLVPDVQVRHAESALASIRSGSAAKDAAPSASPAAGGTASHRASPPAGESSDWLSASRTPQSHSPRGDSRQSPSSEAGRGTEQSSSTPLRVSETPLAQDRAIDQPPASAIGPLTQSGSTLRLTPLHRADAPAASAQANASSPDATSTRLAPSPNGDQQTLVGQVPERYRDRVRAFFARDGK